MTLSEYYYQREKIIFDYIQGLEKEIRELAIANQSLTRILNLMLEEGE